MKLYRGRRSWWEPFETRVEPVARADPLARQIEHFAAVLRGAAEPLVSGRDGLRTLRVTQAVLDAAGTGGIIDTR